MLCLGTKGLFFVWSVSGEVMIPNHNNRHCYGKEENSSKSAYVALNTLDIFHYWQKKKYNLWHPG